MKGDVFIAAGILHAYGDRDRRGLRRARPEDRKFLERDLQLRVVPDQGEQVGSARLQ